MLAPHKNALPDEKSLRPRGVDLNLHNACHHLRRRATTLDTTFRKIEQTQGAATSGRRISCRRSRSRDDNGAFHGLPPSASRGTGVTVSSTRTGFGMERVTQDMFWPIQYDLGHKWLRVGYAFGMYLWPFVEQEKGKYEVPELLK